MLVVRVALLLLMAMIGFYLVFPELFDFRDQLAGDQDKEDMSTVLRVADSLFVKDTPQTISISGHIDSGFSYTLSVYYVATKKLNDKACRERQPSSGKDEPKGAWLSYQPEIFKQQHKIVLPLNAYKPKSLCGYQVELVKLGVHRVGEEATKSDNLFVLTSQVRSLVGNEGMENLNISIDNSLDLECLSTVDESTAVGYWSCRQAHYFEGVLPLQYLDEAVNSSWTINIATLSMKARR